MSLSTYRTHTLMDYSCRVWKYGYHGSMNDCMDALNTPKTLFLRFIVCHAGTINQILHGIGLVVILYGIYGKNIWFFLGGIFIQEFGHIYQYSRTRKKEHSPLHCSLPQLVLIGPLFIAALFYIFS